MPTSSECIGCGYCCKMSVCSYGEWTPLGCKFLIRSEERNRYLCGKYPEIVANEFHSDFPMFGSGCSSSLFNERRRILLEEGRLLW